MHGISVHSALAIKRQRKRRDEQRRARERRFSTDHLSPRLSLTGSETGYAAGKPALANKVMGTITMFHVGTIFLIIGLFLLTGALVPNETKKEMGDLIGTGIICIIIGVFLIILNRIYGQKEEEELTTYVESRLARTKSGQRLYKETSVSEKLNELPTPNSSSKDHSVRKKRSGKKHDHVETVNELKVHANVNGGTVNPGAAMDDISPTAVALERIAEESSEYDRERMYHCEDQKVNDLYRVYDRDYVRGGGHGVV